MPEPFRGFHHDALQFLVDLSANNERSWFQPRKADYERLLKEPLEALCVALAGEFVNRKLPMTADPAKSPFRIYRDVRFAKDKSPYKTNLGASFPWAGAGEGRHGGGYFHLSPENIYVGGGMWHPEPTWLKAWRRLVDESPERVHRVIDDPAFDTRFDVISGDRLQRTPSGYAADHPDAELLKLKDVGFGRELSTDDAASPKLPAIIAEQFDAARAFLELLASVEA